MKTIADYVDYFTSLEEAQQRNSKNVLTPEQANIFRAVIQSYDSEQKIGVLQGGSGSGKSTLIRALKKHCDKENISCVVTASTGKASSALGGVTIHSFLGLSMAENNNAQKSDEAFVLQSKLDNVVESPDILIIDEMSMIGRKLLNEILKNKFNYIFFVGDTNQLPPVKDVAVDWSVLGDYYMLTKTLRTKDEALANVFNDFKLQKEGQLKDLDIFDYVNNRNIVEVDYADLKRLPLNTECSFVGYRNKLVEKMAEQLTQDKHTMFNLNVGVSVTAMKCMPDYETDSNGYFKRDFVQDIRYYNGEDVEIQPLTEVTQKLVQNGVAFVGKWKLKLTKKGILITDQNAKVNFGEMESRADKYFISFPESEVLEYCTLSVIGGDTFSLVWDGSEEEFEGMIEYYFGELFPFLRKFQVVQDFYKGKSDLDLGVLTADVRAKLGNYNKPKFMAWYDEHEDTYRRKRAWANLLTNKKVVSARPTTSRTIHKAQGISVPAVIISDYSFYGASKDAQYVAVTRAKHGLILVRNTPKELVKK